MARKRIALVVKRVDAGFNTQQAFYNKLKENGVSISFDSYKNIESGRCKNIDVFTAICISKVLGETVEEIFLPLETQKMRQEPDSAAQKGGEWF